MSLRLKVMLMMLMFSRVGFGRLLDKQGNAEAGTAADLGRRHQSEMLIDARRRLLQSRSHWYLFMLDLHRFMIAVARVSVNHDGKGGTAPDPQVWDQGSRPKVRKLAIRVNIDLASLPGPSGFLNCSWVQVDSGRITGVDIAAWSYSVGILIRITSFLNTLHCPVLRTLVILVFPFWNFLSNGLVTGCLVKRLLGLTSGLAVLFYFPLFLCQKN